MIDDLHAQHLAAQGAVAGSFEQQRGNNGLIRIFGLESLGNARIGTEDMLTLSLQSFSMPKVTVDAVETQYLNEKRKFAGVPSFEDLTISFKDFVDVNTAHVMKQWHEKVYDPVTGKIGLAKNYKKSAEIELFAPDGTYSRFYTIEGLWPTNFSPGDIDMSSADGVRIETTFAYDKFYAAKGRTAANLQPVT